MTNQERRFMLSKLNERIQQLKHMISVHVRKRPKTISKIARKSSRVARYKEELRRVKAEKADLDSNNQ